MLKAVDDINKRIGVLSVAGKNSLEREDCVSFEACPDDLIVFPSSDIAHNLGSEIVPVVNQK